MNYKLKLHTILFIIFVLYGNHLRAAMLIDNYADRLNWRFYTGTDEAFIGDPYDWSGVGLSTTKTRGQVCTTCWDLKWATLIAPNVFISSAHWSPYVGDDVRFYHSNDPSGGFEDLEVASITQIGSSDIVIGTFTNAASSNVTTYDIVCPDYAYGDVLVFGTTDHNDNQVGIQSQGQGIGTNEITSKNDTSLSLSYVSGDTTHEQLYRGGDSGAPIFVEQNGQVLLTGTAWAVNNNTNTNVASFVSEYVDEIQAVQSSVCNCVPEPNAAILMMIGVGYLLVARKRKRAEILV